MASENVELYLRALEAFNRGDKETWLATCHADLENVPPREWPESRPTKGVGVVWDFLVEGIEPWEEVRFQTVGPIVEGEGTLVAHVEGKVRGKASGAGLVWSYHQAVTIRGDQMVRFDWFADRAEALEAAGISEPEG